jgi:hypothetical protein
MEHAVVAAQPMQVMALTAENIKAQVQLIQKVMRSVMKDGTHYGKIPGAGDKKTLFKPGAEVLCATFRIAPSYQIDDLSDGDAIRYRVRCIATHQGTGAVLGEGMGEGSTNEEKYRWRAAVCVEEFDETPEDRRRIKWKRGNNGNFTIEQVRVVPADIANTVLKMACKRAQVAMTLNVTAASDIFTQDLEDMPEELRGADHGGDDQREAPPRQQQKPATQAPRSTNGNGGGCKATEKQVKLIFARMDAAGIPENELLTRYNLQHLNDIPFAKVDDALAWIAQSNAA